MKKNSERRMFVKRAFLIPMAAAIGMAMAAPVFAGQIYIGDTETVVSYDENGNKVITLVFDPAKTPDFFREQYGDGAGGHPAGGWKRGNAVYKTLPLVCCWAMHMVCEREVL